MVPFYIDVYGLVVGLAKWVVACRCLGSGLHRESLINRNVRKPLLCQNIFKADLGNVGLNALYLLKKLNLIILSSDYTKTSFRSHSKNSTSCVLEF